MKLNGSKIKNVEMAECECYNFSHIEKTEIDQFSDADIWKFISQHTRLLDRLNPRKMAALSQYVLYLFQADGEDSALRHEKNWKFKFDRKWKVKELL